MGSDNTVIMGDGVGTVTTGVADGGDIGDEILVNTGEGVGDIGFKTDDSGVGVSIGVCEGVGGVGDKFNSGAGDIVDVGEGVGDVVVDTYPCAGVIWTGVRIGVLSAGLVVLSLFS